MTVSQSFHAEVTHVTSTHISPAKARHRRLLMSRGLGTAILPCAQGNRVYLVTTQQSPFS